MRLPFFTFGKRNPVQAENLQGNGSPDPRPAEPSQPSYAHETYIPESYTQTAPSTPNSLMGDIDVRALGRALARRKKWIFLPTLAAFVFSLVIVNLIHTRYQSEARILVESTDNIFMRANAAPPDDQRASPDPEAITSQVQLVLSRDLARDIIKKNGLDQLPEFDPLMDGINPISTMLAMLGVVKDPTSMTKEERVLDAYYDRLQAYALDKSRVITVQFQSRDPELAARVANSISEGYLTLQQAAKQDQARSATQWLSGEIESLRKKVADAESRVEEFRSQSSLFVGTNNISLSNQQMGEVSTQLNAAQQQKSDAESKAQLIRQMLQSGKPIEASDIMNSELMRRLNEQRVTLRAQLAEQSSTLLPNHPRIKELKAQIADLDTQIREEAEKIARSLENDARIAGARLQSQQASLDAMKKQATTSNSQDVQLRALDREAKAQRDLLESYLTKYREATTRENLDSAPPDSRIISRGTVSNVPAYPKKLPIVLIATLAVLLLSSGVIVTGELLRMTATAVSLMAPLQTPAEAPRAAPAFEQRMEFATRSQPEAAPVQVAPRPAPPFAPSAIGAAREASDDSTLAERINAVRRKLDPLVAAAQTAMPSPAATYAPPPTMPVYAAPAQAAYAPMMNQPVYAPPMNGPQEAADLAQFAAELRATGPAARKITVVGTSAMSGTAQTALRLARLLARDSRVVLVDLSMPDPVAHAQFEAAAGVSDLVRGLSSFGDVISRDKASSLQIVAAGRSASERAMLTAPRLAMAIDALLQVYDHVVLDGGVITDALEPLLTQHSHAVLIADAELDAPTRQAIADQLTMAGFHAATVLNPAMTGPRDGQGRVAA